MRRLARTFMILQLTIALGASCALSFSEFSNPPLEPPPAHKTISAILSEQQNQLTKFIPIYMEPTNSIQVVATEILDFNLQNFFDLYDLKSSPLFKETEAVNKKLTQNVSVKTQGKESTIEHLLGLKIHPLQRKAQISYQGIFSADFFYKPYDKEYSLELSKNINSKYVVGLTRSFTPGDTSESVNIKWSW